MLRQYKRPFSAPIQKGLGLRSLWFVSLFCCGKLGKDILDSVHDPHWADLQLTENRRSLIAFQSWVLFCEANAREGSFQALKWTKKETWRGKERPLSRLTTVAFFVALTILKVPLWRKLHLFYRSHFKTYPPPWKQEACTRRQMLFTIFKYLFLLQRYLKF